MTSFRDALARLKVGPNEAVSWRGFASTPSTLSAAIASAAFQDFPGGEPPIKEVSHDESWTEECQGVAWFKDAWLFTSNGSQPYDPPIGPTGIYGSEKKGLFLFKPASGLHDSDIAHKLIFATPNFDGYVNVLPPPPWGGPIHHIGAVCVWGDEILVDHWNNESFGHLARVGFDGEKLFLKRWTRIQPVEIDGTPRRLNLVGVNPWDGTLVTCLGDLTPQDRLFVHDLQSGDLLAGREFRLTPAIAPNPSMYIQGGAFSDDGRLFVAVGLDDVKNHQFIYCYSALTARLLYVVKVLTEGDRQELEGICFARLQDKNGWQSQLHAVLLENKGAAKDNVFFKHYAVG